MGAQASCSLTSLIIVPEPVDEFMGIKLIRPEPVVEGVAEFAVVRSDNIVFVV
jgi:hypothetical protein